MTLVAKISLHTQQICGLAWSPDGKLFASGGNDNLCCLFEVSRILRRRRDVTPGRYKASSRASRTFARADDLNIADETSADYQGPVEGNASLLQDGTEIQTVRTSSGGMRSLTNGCESHRWMHGAAVKAIAFCPWRNGLVATGGGSNDKCIHFFHTASGAALATICVSAQVTSLIWSTTRREIAATFGYAQPEHPYRIAIFSWPDCHQVAAIPWDGELRALYAIPYPESPAQTGDPRLGRGTQEGCIVVASSDKSIKFHEVWAKDKKATVSATGMLYGSDILEGLEGIDKEGDVIR